MTRGWCALVLVLAFAGRARADSFDPAAVYKVPLGGAVATGPADAPITIVAWSDFACGYCYRVQFTLEDLERLFPGQLRFVHRTLLLDPENMLATEATLAAAAQGRFRPMSERIYAAVGRVDRAALELFARELGLDMTRFRADLDSGRHRAQIERDLADAVALGVTGTPTFFVNGRAVHGNQPLAVFTEVVDAELVRAAHTPGGYDALVAGGIDHATPGERDRSAHELDAARTYRVGLGLPGHQLGSDDAPLTLVVWGDFQCPYCARLHSSLVHIRNKYGDAVRIVYRHLAMRGHRAAALAAEAAVAAAEQGKFWPFHDRLYEQFGTLSRPELEAHAEAVGLDLVRFRAALDQRRYRELVATESANALALGVDGTPTMFLNGAPIVGSRDIKALDALIDERLATARRQLATGMAAKDLYATYMASAEGVERADPSRVPVAAAITLIPRPEERGRAVAAACRRGDATRARALAAGLMGWPRRTAGLVCTGVGIDL